MRRNDPDGYDGVLPFGEALASFYRGWGWGARVLTWQVAAFFLDAAARCPERSFLLGGNGWQDTAMPGTVRAIGHVGTADRNAFDCPALAMLNVARDSMASVGFAPATRVVEAAGACSKRLARDGADVAAHLRALTPALTPARAQTIGRAALQRVRAQHTYVRRAEVFDRLLRSMKA